MKKGWQIKKLGDVCSFENGDRGENYPSKAVQTTSGVPFINAGHLSEHGIDFSAMNYIPEERFALLGNGKIKQGDILFCLRGSLGKFAPVADLSRGAIASSLVIVRPDDSIMNAYLQSYFRSDLCSRMIDKYKNGAAQPNLSAGSLKNFIIPLPPLPEQRQIVAILDESFESISEAKDNAEKNLRNARELFQSYLQGVFAKGGEDWEEKKLGECFRLKSGDNLTSKAMKDGSFPVFGGNGIAGMHNQFNLSGDNVIIGRVGALCGNARHITEKIWLTDNAFKIVEFSVEYDLPFLTYLLNHKDLRSFARQSAQPVISNSSLKDILLPLPSLREQKAIVATLDSLSAETKKLEAIYQKKLNDLEELKKSLLQKSFDGELTANPEEVLKEAV